MNIIRQTYYVMRPDVNEPIPGYWVEMATNYGEDDTTFDVIVTGLKTAARARAAAQEHAGKRLTWKPAYGRGCWRADTITR